jgi:predicted O-methyltransferase YrrM
LCQANPNLDLYCIDPWYPYREYRDFAKSSTFRSMEGDALERLKKYRCTIIKKMSMDAVKDFTDNALDFVFIDGNHQYEFVRDDIREWTKKVRKGGIVSGHDYYKTPHGNVGVINAVDEYVKEHGYKLELTEWATGVPHDDRQPCWYFTK